MAEVTTPEPRDLLDELTPAEWRTVVSLVEALATSDEAECPVCHRQIDRSQLAEHINACRDLPTVRTRRLEVVDENGRPVVVLGELHHPPSDSTVGLALLEATGRERAVLCLDREGPKLEMASGAGNTALQFGVSDEIGEMQATTYLLVCDWQARPLAGWVVDVSGDLLTVWTNPLRLADFIGRERQKEE